MKLKKLHLFIIIIGALLLGSLGFTVKEGLETMRERYDDEEDNNKYNDRYTNKSRDMSTGGSKSSGGNMDESVDYDDDMEMNNDYILKSAVVPPVCPKCPQRTSCPRQKPCPSCPRPKRCPEPAFDCKKVPNYSSANTNSNLPLAMLNSFSQF